MYPNASCLTPDTTQLLIVDIQDKLLPFIHEPAHMVAQAERMIRAAHVLALPVTVSAQYVRGLGPTHPAIAAAAADAPQFEKLAFSCAADGPQRERLQSLQRPNVLLVGMEAHVCVQQTALDLLGLGMQPVVLADAVSSRRQADCEVALDGLRAAGAIVTTVEAAIFQMVHESGTELFKRILPLVR
jgi:nicotinamidase-related amidase